MTHLLHNRLAAATLAALFAGPACAGFSDVYFFGDSLSDTGNALVLTGGAAPVAPYFSGRFSDGPVWTEYLAASLGHADAAKPSLQGGHNYAVGGARFVTGAYSVNDQINAFTATLPTSDGWPVGDGNALYVLVAGGNDMRDARSGDPAQIGAAAAATAFDFKNALFALAARGAKHVLIANLPDLGATPEAAALGLTAESTQATNAFNALMGDVVSYGRSVDLQMSFFDFAGLSAAVRNDALTNGGAVYGITNITSPCGSFQGSDGSACSVSQFSDALHPSAASHRLMAEAAFAAAVPEPATYGMMALGLGIVGLMARRRRAG